VIRKSASKFVAENDKDDAEEEGEDDEEDDKEDEDDEGSDCEGTRKPSSNEQNVSRIPIMQHASALHQTGPL
jgi:hypothetical protein